MDDLTKNITQADLAQAYASGFADGSVVRDETAVSAEQYAKLQRAFTELTMSNSKLKKDYDHLVAEHNRVADAVAKLQSIRDTADKCPGIVYSEDVVNSTFGVLDALGEVSPF